MLAFSKCGSSRRESAQALRKSERSHLHCCGLVPASHRQVGARGNLAQGNAGGYQHFPSRVRGMAGFGAEYPCVHQNPLSPIRQQIKTQKPRKPTNTNRMNTKLNSLKTGLTVALVLGALHLARAATSVCGPVTGTWTPGNSPYLVTCDIQAYDLTIQPGVEIRFQGPYVFEVDTKLQAQGTVNAPIVFTNDAGVVGWNGIFFNNSSPSSLTYCHVYGSTNSGIRILNATPAVSYCVIANNSAPLSGGGVYASLISGTVLMNHCTITNNTTRSSAGADDGGGGIWVNGNAEINDCYIAGNTNNPLGNEASGGGVHCLQGSTVLRRCTILGNRSFWGGGIALWSDGHAQLFNCLVAANSSGDDAGGGIMVHGRAGARADVVNCTIAGNSPHGIRNANLCYVTNSILYFNNSGGAQISGSPNVIEYSDIQNWLSGGTGNITDNPGLCAANQSLSPGSACIDTGNPDPAYYDPCTGNDFCSPSPRGTFRNDMGAYGGPGAYCQAGTNCLVIVSQPQSQSSCLAGSATFSVTVTGSEPLSYQWYFGNTPMSGRTDEQLTLTNLQGTNSGLYKVVVTNSCGNKMSDPAQLNVFDACVDICMIAGLTISGQSGSKYVLKYTTDVSNTNFTTWTPLATNTMGSSSWLYEDWGSCGQPRRFYGVRLLP